MAKTEKCKQVSADIEWGLQKTAMTDDEDAYNLSLLQLVTAAENPFTKAQTALIWRDPTGPGDLCFSYEKIFTAAENLCTALNQLGVIENSRIGFLLTENIYFCLPSIIIGILKHNCTFVPLSPLSSKTRLLEVRTNWLITDERRDGTLPVVILLGCPVFIWRMEPNMAEPESSFAYSTTTSGTTGQPKRIDVPHKAIVPNIIFFKNQLKLGSEDLVFQSAPPTFDPFVVELFTTFSAGGRLVMVPAFVKSRADFLNLVLMQHPRPTVVQATPSLIKSLGTTNIKNLLGPTSTLKALVFGGESCPDKILLRKWKDPQNNTKIFNIYGVSEVSCWSTCHNIDVDSNNPVLLGEVLPFNKLQILFAEGVRLDVGIGELCITTGDRMCTVNGKSLVGKWHATGDSVNVRVDGSVEFIGRKEDSRIFKKFGQKISLAEIEQTALENVLVQDCVAISNIIKGLDIVLFVLTSSKLRRNCLELEILSHLQNGLPPISVPTAVIKLKKFTMTGHFKIDKRNLVCTAQSWLRRSKVDLADTNTLERIVREAWVQAIGVEAEVDITESSNFILSGGDSAKAMFIYRQLLIKVGLQDEVPELLTTILEKTFHNICDTLKGLRGKVQVVEEMPSPEPLEIRPEQCTSQTSTVNFMICKGKSAGIPKSTDIKFKRSTELQELWRVDFLKCIDASPLLVGYNCTDISIFVGSHSGKFSCIEFESGKEVWTTRLPDRIEATATVSACGNLVLVGCYGGSLYGINAHQGTTVWRFETKGMIKSSVVLRGGRVFIGSYDQAIYCLSLKDGLELWKMELQCGSILATPCLVENRLIVATLGGILFGLCPETGTIHWRDEKRKPYFSSPLPLPDNKFIVGDVSGCVRILNAANGVTGLSLQIDAGLFSSISLNGSAVYFASKNNLYCADCETLRLNWHIELADQITSTPILNSNFVVLSSLEKLLVLDVNARKIVFCKTMTGEVFSTSILYDNRLIVGCRDNNLYCFKIVQ